MEPAERTTQEKISRFVESPIAWGGIGLLGGAIVALVPAVGLKWFFVAAWVLLVSAQIKEKFWGGKGWGKRISGNVLLSAIFGAVLIVLWHYIPKPREPYTPKEFADELCKRSPWLCSPQLPSEPAPPVTQEAACHLRFSTSTEAVARLYGRHDIPTTPKADLSIDFQELFYEWKALFTGSRPIGHLTVKISHLTDADVVTVVPASQSSISEFNPEWFSGFREPARAKADYYSRIVTFDSLAKGDKATISLRRALDVAEVSPVNMVRIDDARANDCSAASLDFDENMAAKKIDSQLQALANFKWGQIGGPARPLPLRHDPGDVGKDEVETTVEARCKNPSCSQTNVGRLEVHMGRPPTQPVRVTVDKRN